MAHKLYAQLEVDLGRARDAMARLIERAQSADPELLAGLVSACRYCGLLDASVAAHARALDLEPRIRTSVGHTWFLQGDHTRVATVKIAEYPYIVPPDLSIAGTAAPAATLRLMLGVLAVGGVVLLPSLYYLFRVFKGSRQSSVIRHP